MLELDGQKLSLAEVSAVARGAERVSLASTARVRVEKSRAAFRAGYGNLAR